MENKKNKKLTPLNILLIASLLINIFTISNMRMYQNFISEEINRSLEIMRDSLESSREAGEEIIRYGKIDENQYRKIYYDYDDFEKEFKKLKKYISSLKSQSINFSGIQSISDIKTYLYSFAREKGLSRDKVRGDEIITINLTNEEIEKFKSVNRKTIEYLRIFNDYDITSTRTVNVLADKWVLIIEELYQYSIDSTLVSVN